MTKNIALVVGGTGGIGRECVKTLVADGMEVCFTYHQNEDMAKKLESDYQNNAHAYILDLLDQTSVENAIKSIINDRGIVSVLVFAVTSPVHHKNILNAEWQEYEKHLLVQVRGLFQIVQGLKNQILNKSKLKIIVVSTEYTIGKPPSGLSHYVQAKYALAGLSKSIAVDLAKYQCTVNLVSPGMVDTALLSNLPPKLLEITAESNPLKRIASANDVAKVISFLANPKTEYLNGSNITINGGNIML